MNSKSKVTTSQFQTRHKHAIHAAIGAPGEFGGATRGTDGFWEAGEDFLHFVSRNALPWRRHAGEGALTAYAY